VDNTEGTREATEHLLSTTPPDRCFFVGGPKENFDTKARAEVFCATLATAGRPCTEPQVSCGEYSVDWGRAWGRERQRGAGLKGCAVLAANDEIALGVMQAAQEAGVRVPEDLKIVGFDDTRLATLVRPSLSTVRVPLQDVGAAAVRLLVERVTDSEKPATRMKVGTKLVIRESSR
jgi:LacI family transcriptional regulator